MKLFIALMILTGAMFFGSLFVGYAAISVPEGLAALFGRYWLDKLAPVFGKDLAGSALIEPVQVLLPAQKDPS